MNDEIYVLKMIFRRSIRDLSEDSKWVNKAGEKEISYHAYKDPKLSTEIAQEYNLQSLGDSIVAYMKRNDIGILQLVREFEYKKKGETDTLEHHICANLN
jgi:hypothetical protein